MLVYQFSTKDGRSHGPFNHLCYAFLYTLEDGKLKGYPLHDIIQISVSGKCDAIDVDELFTFNNILKESMFGKLWNRSVFISKKKFIFSFNPKTWNLTDVLVIGQLVRLSWESPHIMKNIIEWHKKGYSNDLSILLGHFLDTELRYEGLVNKTHMLFKDDMGLKNILSDFKKLLDRVENSTIIDQQDPEIYSPEYLFFLSRHYDNRLSKGFINYLSRKSTPPFWTFTLSDEALQEICDNV